MRNLSISLILIFTVTALAIPQTTKGTFVAKGQGVVRRAAAAGGGGSFPVNGVLDNFNRADEGPPPSASWAAMFSAFSGNQCSVLSNQVVCTGSTGGAYWSASTFGPDVEVYAKLVTAGTDGPEIMARITDPTTSSISGYEVYSDGTVIQFYRLDSTAYVQLGANVTQTVSAGDSLGLTVIGNTLEGWYKSGAGAWASIGTRTDSTYTTAGNIALKGSGITFDDFGGGNR